MIDWLSQRAFAWMHRQNLVYNACWEDPRVDRAALELTSQDSVLMITSAGCNALDYALDAPVIIHTVDLNPRQNALLELKRAAIRALDFEPFFDLFGRGRLAHYPELYRRHLRPQLEPDYRRFWDDRMHYFTGSSLHPTFYFRGTAGLFARALGWYIDFKRARGALSELFAASSLEDQQRLYPPVRARLWTQLLSQLLGWDGTLSLLGVPRQQRKQVEGSRGSPIAHFVEDCLDAVFMRLPISDNYFWSLYVDGRYTHDRCPEYLKEPRFLELKAGLVERIQVHTGSILGFLNGFDGQFTRFVLLDHMDWLATTQRDTLQAEWQAIVDHAAPRARLIWRSGSLHGDFVDDLSVRMGAGRWRLGDLLAYDRDRAAHLHELDRVHTYASFHIADLALT